MSFFMGARIATNCFCSRAGNFELVEALCEVLHQRVEILAPDAHAGMHRPHVAAGIDAGAAGSLADLLDEMRLEPIDIGIGEESVDALVGRDVLHEVVDHGRNGAIRSEEHTSELQSL